MMDFIIIAALILLVVWFLLGAESKLKAWFKLRFKQFYSLLGKKKYQKQHKVRAADDKPGPQSINKDVNAPKVDVSNQNTNVRTIPVDPTKIVAYPVIMHDQVVSLIKQNPSWLQVIEVHQLIELIDNGKLALNEKIKAISHHTLKSQHHYQNRDALYDKVSEKLFSLISQLELSNLSNLYDVKSELIQFKSHFADVAHLCESFLKSNVSQQVPNRPNNLIAEQVMQIIQGAKGDVLQVFSKLLEFSKSDLFIAEKSKKEVNQSGKLVNFIEKLLLLDFTADKLNFAQQLSDIPRIDETVQKTLGNTKN